MAPTLDQKDPILVLSDQLCDILNKQDVLTCVAAMALSLTSTLEWMCEQSRKQAPAHIDDLQAQLESLICDIIATRDAARGSRRTH